MPFTTAQRKKLIRQASQAAYRYVDLLEGTQARTRYRGLLYPALKAGVTVQNDTKNKWEITVRYKNVRLTFDGFKRRSNDDSSMVYVDGVEAPPEGDVAWEGQLYKAKDVLSKAFDDVKALRDAFELADDQREEEKFASQTAAAKQALLDADPDPEPTVEQLDNG